MQKLSPTDVVELTSKAFVLEAITNKPGCTTRYEDLPGKPLQDFLMAGINSAKFFGMLAEDLEADTDSPLFAYAAEALSASNKHKSDKFINLGLIEIMTFSVAARLKDNNPSTVIDTLIELVQKENNEDVLNNIAMRSLAWSTSSNPTKNTKNFEEYEKCQSMWQYFDLRCKNHAPDTSFYQWSNQYLQDLPILRKFFEGYTSSGEVMTTTNTIFEEIMSQYPKVRVGIVADLCAAAIFIWLSFNTKPL